jgi:hypothetical protein
MLSLLLSFSLSQAPADFIADVKPLFDVVTCQAAVPSTVDAATVASYCKTQKPSFDRFREHWGVTAKEFLTKLRPAKLPTELVYPFGGGDLMSALMAFPEAQVITTMSLELSGDPRRLKSITDKKVLANSLKAIGNASTSTLTSNDSLSKNLSKIQQGELPGQLSMHLMGLSLFSYEPTSVRYFKIEADGSLHYYSLEEVQALEKDTAKNLNAKWKYPDFSVAFANVEVQFVPQGQPNAPPRIHRHIGANLSNEGLAANPGLLEHLKKKGRVAAMTKAASYLLWSDSAFSTIRDYLVSNADYMVSDSTGVPPRWWKKQGCTVETYGRFEKSFLPAWEGYQKEFREEFKSAKNLPIRFGYPDGSENKLSHLMVARCSVK